jgi:hypothetical protein
MGMGCGSSRTISEGRSSLDNAIAYFIEGNHAEAETLLTKLVGERLSDEDLQTAYLYLGRIYMARGEHDRAADAFYAGRLLGGDFRFLELFHEAREHLWSSSHSIDDAPSLSRGQLAAVINGKFARFFARANIDSSSVVSVPAPDVREDYWAAGFIGAVASAEIMRVMPDGRFHPEEKVTRPAFFFIVSRLARFLDLSPLVVGEVFPGGLASVVAPGPSQSVSGENNTVSGREVMRALEEVASSVRTRGGEAQ